MRRTLYSFEILTLIFLAVAVYYRVTPQTDVALNGPVDRILIDKSERRMWVFREGELLKAYPIALGFAPEGDKVREGDGKTPEGIYKIDRKNPQSRFHLSLGLNYPLPEDRARGQAGGYSPGGDIFIHGQPSGVPWGAHIGRDWTLGCIAVSNRAMDELFAAVAHGTEIEVRP